MRQRTHHLLLVNATPCRRSEPWNRSDARFMTTPELEWGRGGHDWRRRELTITAAPRPWSSRTTG
jgi:hypothetical protein